MHYNIILHCSQCIALRSVHCTGCSFVKVPVTKSHFDTSPNSNDARYGILPIIHLTDIVIHISADTNNRSDV